MGNSDNQPSLPSPSFMVRVTKVFDHGIQVERVDDKREGYIRRREITWERRLSKSVKMPEVGDIVEAVILPEEAGEEKHTPIRMSLRRVHDPWAEATAKYRYKKHGIVEGEIVNVLPDRAYAQLEPGIDAVIYPRGLPKLRELSIDDVLWLGDRVSGEITSVSPGHVIEISQVKRLQRMDPSCEGQRILLEEYFGARNHPRIINLNEPPVISEQPPEKIIRLGQSIGRLVRILVIDNEEEWLKYLQVGLSEAFSVPVDGVMTGEEALESIRKNKEYNLILIDLQLHNERGIEVGRSIRQALPNMAILITSAAPFEETDKHAEFSYCPKNLDDLIDQINLLRLGIIRENPLLKPLAESVFVHDLDKQARERRNLPEILSEILASLHNKVQVSYCLLIQKVGERSISIIAAQPAIPNEWVKTMQAHLYFSPARQIIELEQELCENHINFEFDPKFTNFFPLLAPRSCFALPVRIPDRVASYALVLVSDQPDAFKIEQAGLAQLRLQDARMAGQYLSLALERATLLEQMRLYDEKYALGQLLGDLVHETNNKLNGLLAHINTQKKHLNHHPEWQKTHLLDEWFSGLEQETAKFQSDYDDLKSLVDAYARQSKYHYEPVDINYVVEKVARQLSATAKRLNINIYMHREQPLPPALGVYAHIQQAVMNLMLNAIQMIHHQSNLMKLIGEQMVYTSPLLQTGLVIVQTRIASKQASRPLEIRVIDSGPGIHWLERERIFEQGFSRRGGAGLGLNISSNLIERMGGRVNLLDSILFIGSAFVIELPCYPEGEDEQ